MDDRAAERWMRKNVEVFWVGRVSQDRVVRVQTIGVLR